IKYHYCRGSLKLNDHEPHKAADNDYNINHKIKDRLKNSPSLTSKPKQKSERNSTPRKINAKLRTLQPCSSNLSPPKPEHLHSLLLLPRVVTPSFQTTTY
ncbi:hypothetical protein M758_3G189900, partial [Ceratodon purpureus]